MITHDPSRRYCIVWGPELVEVGVMIEGRGGVPIKLIIGFGRSEDDVFMRIARVDDAKSGVKPGDVLRTLMRNPDPKYDPREIIAEAARLAGIPEIEAWEAAKDFALKNPPTE